MKWLPRAAAALAVGLFALSACGQEAKHPEKPFLWKIEGNGLKRPGYLFGTIHLSNDVIGNLHPAATKAFDSADTLYTEIPMGTEVQMSLVPLMIRKDGKTLKESIGPDLSAALDEELAAVQPSLDSTPFQALKTWAVMVTLPMLKSQLEGRKPLDSILWDKAKAAGKATLGIETAAGQIAIFERFIEEESVKMLSETLAMLKDDRKAGISSIDNLLAAYEAGDPAKLEAEIRRGEKRMLDGENKALGERFLKLLMTDRNLTMAETIDKQLRIDPSRSLFFAVGAGHLIGNESINDHLAKKGYTVTRVQD